MGPSEESFALLPFHVTRCRNDNCRRYVSTTHQRLNGNSEPARWNCSLVPVTSGAAWKWRNAHLAFYSHIPRNTKHHAGKGTRSIFSQWFQLLRLCKIHNYLCVQCAQYATIGYHYVSSLYAGLPDGRPPISSRVSILSIELKRRANLQAGDMMSPWSRPIRIVTLKAVSSLTRSVLCAGNCLSWNAAWFSVICVLDDNFTGCEDHKRGML